MIWSTYFSLNSLLDKCRKDRNFVDALNKVFNKKINNIKYIEKITAHINKQHNKFVNRFNKLLPKIIYDLLTNEE